MKSPRRIDVGIGLAGLAMVGAVACGETRPARGPAAPSVGRIAVAPTGAGTVSVGCASAVSSPRQSWSDRWPTPTDRAIVAGPIAWPDALGLATDVGAGLASPAAAYAPYRGLSLVVEHVVAVTNGKVARVSIPAAERTRLSMDYTGLQPRTAAGRYAVADGASEVTFHACSPGSTAGPSTLFVGGFIVAGAQCARVAVYTGASSRPIERGIPFGVPASRCRSGR